MIRSELQHHKLAYTILILALICFVVVFFGVWPNRVFQRVSIVAMASFYILWGAVTHFKSEHITKNILYEYLGVATLAGVLLLLVTF
jgi:hypothetical protein